MTNAGFFIAVVALAVGIAGALLSQRSAETARLESSKLEDSVEALELRLGKLESQVEKLGSMLQEAGRSSAELTSGEGTPTKLGVPHGEVVIPKKAPVPSAVDAGAIPDWVRKKYPRSLRGLLATLDVSDSQTLGFKILTPARDESGVTGEERLLATDYLSLHWEELADRDAFTQRAIQQGEFVEVFETREEAGQAQKSRMSCEVHQTADGRFGLIDIEALLEEDPVTGERRERMRTIQELLGVKVCSVTTFERE